jgi:hypothetical protein
MGQLDATALYKSMSNSTVKNALEESEKTFSAFSGADIVAYMGHKRVASLQGITVSITREVMPVFVMGDPNPKAFTKGKRAIAGNLVFTQFDKHAILKMSKLLNENVNFIGDIDYFKVPDNIKLNNLQTQDITVQNIGSTFGAGGFAPNAYLDPVDNKGRRHWRWAEPDNTSGASKVMNNNANPTNGPSTCPWTYHDCGPNNEWFSFHVGGAHACMADGSVRFIRDSIPLRTVYALGTRDGGEIFDLE